MQVPIQISFQQLEHSDALEYYIRNRISQLERFCPNMISTRVVVGLSTHRQRQGKLFRVRIDLNLPGSTIVVDRDPSNQHAHEDPYVAVRDAFRAAKRQLEDYVRIHFFGKKRHHERPPQGKIVRLLMENDGGFIKSADGRELYFHKNSVLHDAFKKIRPGDEVRFVEEQGEKGPQASSVERVGKWGTHTSHATDYYYKPWQKL